VTAGAAPAAGLCARVHATEPRSRANGPGARFVIWLQGCTLGCPGCFNPSTHQLEGGQERSVEALLVELASTAGIEGLTLSGGEPLQQPEVAAELLAGARALGLSTLVFSGYRQEEIEQLPHGRRVLAATDVLIDGRYQASERLASGLRGSQNQRIVLLSARYSLDEVEATPVAEIRISPRGELVLTGVNPLKLKR
jgi:anaerobic ribonucleoside-triphosphate reductase activating protein